MAKKSNRGFAALSADERKKIASKGGKAKHKSRGTGKSSSASTFDFGDIPGM